MPCLFYENPTFIAAARMEYPKANATLRKMLELHQPWSHIPLDLRPTRNQINEPKNGKASTASTHRALSPLV